MKLLDDISVSSKLWGLTLALVAGLATSAFVTQRMQARAADEAMARLQDYDGRIVDSIQWRRLVETNVQRVIAMAVSQDPVLERNFERKSAEAIAAIAAMQKRVVEKATSEADRKQLDEIARQRVTVLAAVDKSKHFDNRAGADAAGQAQAFVDSELNPAVEHYLKSLEDFGQLQQAQREQALAEVQAAERRASRTQLALTVLAALAGLAFAAAVVRSIVRPLREAVEMSTAIAAGDLTVDVASQRRDELGQMLRSMQTMVARLRSIVNEVRSGVDAVGTASSQIAIGNVNLSQRTEEQAGSLQQTAASMEQLTSTVQQNADSAAEVSRIATGAAEAALHGGEAMREVVDTMNGIQTGAQRIAEIATVIDGIAFQTNILALNAAIEAARAGPQGRGFAVVAGEVRALAHRSAAAAKDIKGLIDVSVADAASGSERVRQAASAIERIVQQVQSVNGLIQEISTASHEQARGVSEVGVAISQLDTMTQQNAALVEESTAATESMAEMSVRLAGAMSAFRLEATPAHPHSRP
ncbi:methyl-accepting chemotaxis protein [Paucibacter sp. R3-3]|uniref:Methyl-accepting chemotaxis protein n=1 Tax=Roseateles agri TaxID=3098619 RepID=A0ABU5DM70_9BURK|nr:methyl-accepting chemotaxis protein [Paucibacter sp. R3-3]MDY0746823.1 methyl-accepting chemotaxis protein [Paucibacter sp. R3-3]